MIDREWEEKRYARLMREMHERQDRLDVAAGITPPFPSRILAAIAKAEDVFLALPPRHSGKVTWYATYTEGTTDIKDVLTATEVALAKELWDVWRSEFEGPDGFTHFPEALRDFTEKVESL